MRAVTGEHVQHAAGETDAVGDRCQLERGERAELRGLEHDRAACSSHAGGQQQVGAFPTIT
jgi:hypothetical protein